MAGTKAASVSHHKAQNTSNNQPLKTPPDCSSSSCPPSFRAFLDGGPFLSAVAAAAARFSAANLSRPSNDGLAVAGVLKVGT